MPRNLTAAPRSSVESTRGRHLQFRIRDLLVLILLTAAALGWWVDRAKLLSRLEDAERQIQSRDEALAAAIQDYQLQRDRLIDQYWGTMRLVERMARAEWTIPRGAAAAQVLSFDPANDQVELGFGQGEGIERGDIVTIWQHAPRGRTCAALVRVASIGPRASVGRVMHGDVQLRDLAVAWERRPGEILCGMDLLRRDEE